MNQEPEQSQKAQKVQKKSIDTSFWILLFTIAFVKDFAEIFITLLSLASNSVPLIGQVVSGILTYLGMAISILLGAMIFILLLFKGKTGLSNRVKQLITAGIGLACDSIPFLSFVPLATITMFIVFLLEKSGLEKIVKKIVKPSPS